MKKWRGAILLGAWLLSGCAGLFFEEPVIALKEIHVQQLSLTDASLVFVAEIQNPNGYELRLKSLDYTVHLDGRETGGGSLEKESPYPPPPRRRSTSRHGPFRQPGGRHQALLHRPGTSLQDRGHGPREGRPLRPHLPLLPHRCPVPEKVLTPFFFPAETWTLTLDFVRVPHRRHPRHEAQLLFHLLFELQGARLLAVDDEYLGAVFEQAQPLQQFLLVGVGREAADG